MPPEDPDEKADLLRRLLDHDRQVEDLEAEIAAAEAELKDMRKRLVSAVLARAKLSREIRKPRPMLSEAGGLGAVLRDIRDPMADPPKRKEQP